MKHDCHDCLWRDFPAAARFCPHPERRESAAPPPSECRQWEWRYE